MGDINVPRPSPSAASCPSLQFHVHLICLDGELAEADLGREAGGKLGEVSVRTRRADIVQHLVGADLGVDSLDSSSHDELLGRTGEGRGEVGMGSAGAELVDSPAGADRVTWAISVSS